MPGIAGVISAKPADLCTAMVDLMRDAMSHQAFYHSGQHNVSELGVYCAWVGHPVSLAVAQPFVSQDKKTALLLSGECYSDDVGNVQSGQEASHEFEDGRCIISLYKEYGEQLFLRLNGIFSGLLIDQEQGRSYLFNDRYGLERIYWHEAPDAFYFASEAKALLRVLPELRRFDHEGVVEFLHFGCTRGTRTLFPQIHTLPAASLWCFDGVRTHRRTYFSISSWENQSHLDPSAFNEEFDAVTKSILPRYYRPDHKVGISLTAGIDGRVLMASMPDGPGPVCYTFAGEGTDLLDARIAERVAVACRLEHHVLRLDDDFFSAFPSHADRTVYLTDGCLGPTGAHEVYFNQKARTLAPIRLTGVFGGEILRSLSFSYPTGLDQDVLNVEYRTLFDDLRECASASHVHPVTSAISSEIPQRRFGVVAAGRSQTVFRTPYLDNKLVALAYRIPPRLRASSEPQISFIRKNSDRLSEIPTDMGLLGRSWPLPGLVKRMHGRVTFKLDYFYNEGFPIPFQRLDAVLQTLGAPARIIGRHKFLRYRHWFRRELSEYVCARLKDAADRQPQIWDTASLNKISSDIRENQTQKNWTHEINLILTLEAVERQLFASGDANSKASLLHSVKPSVEGEQVSPKLSIY